jgi:hypothetical protein
MVKNVVQNLEYFNHNVALVTPWIETLESHDKNSPYFKYSFFTSIKFDF